MNLFKKSKGFTLVEIVVVIGIMGFLSAVIYSSFDTSRAKSRDQKRVSDVSSIQLALEQYFQKNGVYPVGLDTLTQLDPLTNKVYISSIPSDPTNIYSAQYFPLTKVSGNDKCISYQLWTTFELSNVYLTSKKSFDSTVIPKNGLFECGGDGTHVNARINASSSPLVYDVMP